jgi:hypothetical protein
MLGPIHPNRRQQVPSDRIQGGKAAGGGPKKAKFWGQRGEACGGVGVGVGLVPSKQANDGEAFTCTPLKKMVPTYVPLKRLLAPVCHRPKLL